MGEYSIVLTIHLLLSLFPQISASLSLPPRATADGPTWTRGPITSCCCLLSFARCMEMDTDAQYIIVTNAFPFVATH